MYYEKQILFKVLVGLTLIFTFSACNNDDTDDTPKPTKNIIELAQENGFTSLAAALTRAGLIDDLQAAGTFTVFAPTNEAFANLLTAIGQTSIDDVPVPVLEQILLYHVLQSTVKSADVTTGSVSTLQGGSINLAAGTGITVNNAGVIPPFDVEATNGIIHSIDQVLVPQEIDQFVNTVLEPAYFNNSFSTLVAAAVKANLVTTILSANEITIFAPTNQAFTDAGIDVDALDAATLASVLTYHTIGANVLSSGIPTSAATLNENELFFSLTDNGNFINGNTEIVAVDIESGNGVVHVIDNVLLPPVGNVVETAISLSAGGEFTSLIAALQRTADEGSSAQNLISVLSGTGPFTVFAPTNAAFQALLDSNADWNGLGDIPLETLVAVLTYHVVPARAYDKDLASAIDANNQLPTAQGGNLTFDLNNLTINTDVNIIAAAVNNNATNGVIHAIDKVLLP